MLAASDLTVLDIAGRFGYDNGSKFAVAFRDVMGLSPKEYREAKSRPNGVLASPNGVIKNPRGSEIRPNGVEMCRQM